MHLLTQSVPAEADLLHHVFPNKLRGFVNPPWLISRDEAPDDATQLSRDTFVSSYYWPHIIQLDLPSCRSLILESHLYSSSASSRFRANFISTERRRQIGPAHHLAQRLHPFPSGGFARR